MSARAPVRPAPSVLAAQGPAEALHHVGRAVERTAVHPAQRVDDVRVGAVRVGERDEVVAAGGVVGALERLLHVGHLHGQSWSFGSGSRGVPTRGGGGGAPVAPKAFAPGGAPWVFAAQTP